jgi:hypothetical protein
MNLVMWVLVAVLASLVVSPDPGMVGVTIVTAVGAAGLIVARRTIWPAIT